MKHKKNITIKKTRIKKLDIETSEEIFPGLFQLPDGSLLNTQCEPEVRYIREKKGMDSEQK